MADVATPAGLATKVLSTVNAPYGANLTAYELAAKIADPASVNANDASVFAFFSEVREELQRQFIAQMGIDPSRARTVAAQFAVKAGYSLPLAD
ncbi:hypothetical protein [Methylobacterium nonmethylotrophicum]|uniref:Uncharacterized protein n=1 Tax=Methylobacterium nonmethylotrophicum TaxID=1141884 RepID=A0A4Z0NLN1_9HYPH|nr:hypothetical protein [Methylobacterium nonmethylotrophicum]TGD97365.1 hypothetical protein EU555_19535 [Methylobacterium nonmethylotrophicum]